MFLVSCTGADMGTSTDTVLEGLSPLPISVGISSLPLAGEAGAIAGGDPLPLVAKTMSAMTQDSAVASSKHIRECRQGYEEVPDWSGGGLSASLFPSKPGWPSRCNPSCSHPSQIWSSPSSPDTAHRTTLSSKVPVLVPRPHPACSETGERCLAPKPLAGSCRGDQR